MRNPLPQKNKKPRRIALRGDFSYSPSWDKIISSIKCITVILPFVCRFVSYTFVTLSVLLQSKINLERQIILFNRFVRNFIY